MYYLSPRYKNINVPVYITEQKVRKSVARSHFHKSMEVIRVNEGKIECCIGTKKYECVKGDIVFVPPYALHSVISLVDNTAIQGIVFKPSLAFGENSTISVDNILNKDRIKTPVLRFGTEINHKIQDAFFDTVNQYDNEKITYELDMKASICRLLSLIIQEYYVDNNEMEEYDRLVPVMEYIKKNYKERLYISELSEILNICDDHLIRLFKGTIGITPMKYINGVRLEEAQKLLVNTEYSVTDISFAVGFSSVSYFSKIFAEVFEMSPSTYRKEKSLKT